MFGIREIVTTIVSIVLLLLLMSASGEDVEAYGLRMDISLKYAYASFIGEGVEDHAGVAVAIAGDVNGDGYDDILVGAHYNGESATEAGQTYLIFGKASGWSVGMDLFDADASFLGEGFKDWSGEAIAGAGDVNNDGFDDILIGAPSLGQDKAYLIFGKLNGWAMDTSLSQADVTFTSEGHDPRTGESVASAGDVNNDGYDDILIGAPFTAGTGDKITGHTYLVLGRASGWPSDMDLSREANASFLGEVKDDAAGFSIDGAGDVNGDGYDDILIGAWKSDDRVHGAGQTYLIFGKDTGWELDTWLSNSDASFIGASRYDLTGYSVAGAGDVSGDGFADILIGGYGVSDTGLNAGGTYLILGKASGWSMDTNLSTADASYFGEDSGDWAGRAVASAGDVNSDGFDDFLTGATWNDDGGINAGQTYLILGKPIGWSRGTSLSDADASFVGENRDDFIGYSIAGGGDVNNDGHADILIGTGANDDGGDGAGKTYLLLFDDEAPSIVEDSSPSSATTGDLFIFNISASDNLRLNNLTIEYWYGNSIDHRNLSATQISGDILSSTWHLSITITPDSIRPLHYIAHVCDFAGLVTSSVQKDVTVRDDDEPIISDQTSPYATTGDPFVLRASAWDNIGLADVSVEYWFGDAVTHTVMQMVHSPEEYWYYVLSIPPDSVEKLHVLFMAKDATGNEARTHSRDIEVLDNDNPRISDDETPKTGTTGGPLLFSIGASDNIGVDKVSVEYWYGGSSSHANESMEEGPTSVWTLGIIMANDTVLDLHYFFCARDIGTNWAIGPTRVVEIVDNDAPIVIEDLSLPETETGADYTVSIELSDNVEVMAVEMVYRFNDGNTEIIELMGKDVDATGSGLYERMLTMPVDSVGPFCYIIIIYDSSENLLVTDERSVALLDTIPPVAGAGADLEIDQGDIARLDGNDSSDNIGIVVWRWTFEHGDTELNLESETVHYEFVHAGVYTVTLYVADRAGNEAIDTLELIVHDTETPNPQAQGILNAIKGEKVIFDGSHSTDNVGIVEWTWNVEYESGRRDVVTGETIEYVFDEAGDHTVTLTVKDAEGNEATGATFTVHVPNVVLGIVIILVFVGVIVAAVIFIRKRGFFQQQG